MSLGQTRPRGWPAAGAAALLAGGLLLAMPLARADPSFTDQRLFTTAAERARLDQLRAGRDQADDAAGDGGERAQRRQEREAELARQLEQAKAEPESAPTEPFELRGFVRRSGGPETVWIDQGSTIDGRIPERLKIHEGRIDRNSVVVTTPDGRTVRIRPGQTWDPASGRAVDSFRR